MALPTALQSASALPPASASAQAPSQRISDQRAAPRETARTCDLLASVASVSGKVELVYEGEREGIEAVAHPTDTGEESSLRDAISASELPDKVQSFFYVDIRGGLGLVALP